MDLKSGLQSLIAIAFYLVDRYSLVYLESVMREHNPKSPIFPLPKAFLVLIRCKERFPTLSGAAFTVLSLSTLAAIMI